MPAAPVPRGDARRRGPNGGAPTGHARNAVPPALGAPRLRHGAQQRGAVGGQLRAEGRVPADCEFPKLSEWRQKCERGEVQVIRLATRARERAWEGVGGGRGATVREGAGGAGGKVAAAAGVGWDTGGVIE